MGEETPLASRFLASLAERDYAALKTLLHPEIEFRALVPSALREANSPDEVEAVLRDWWGGASEFEVDEVAITPAGDRWSVAYRVRLTDPDGRFHVHQQLYADRRDGLIGKMHVLCSGFLPVGDRPAGGHRFDAGTMGCTDGLSGEFRRQILGIQVGETLEVVARDPSARSDLPSLARMMGHHVQAVETQDDGSLLITVERGR